MATVMEEERVEEQRGRERLTDKRLEKLVAPRGGRLEIADALVRELRVRVGKTGKKSWSMLYRVAHADGSRGKMKRMNLGVYPTLSLSDARDKAREALEAADKGIDPAVVRAKEIDQRQTRTFEVVLERYVELHVKMTTRDGQRAKAAEELARKEAEETGTKPRKVGRCPAERLLTDLVEPKWRGRLIESIRRAEVIELIDDIVLDRGANVAREVRKHLVGLFSWAIDRDLLDISPAAGIKRKDLKYVARDRELSMDELRRVWDAAGEVAYPFGDLVRLLILTGQRRSEIAELERDWFEPDEERMFVIPADKYKTGIKHAVPLSAPAWRIIESLPRWNEGEFLLSGSGGRRPFSGFSKAKAALDKKIAKRAEKEGLAPLKPWTLHDIRRSVTTRMIAMGIREEHVERVMGHLIPGVARTYNHHSYLPEKRAALEKWGKLWS
ncbi:site-specific integrase [Sandaracinobacter neustonicus]|uniref:Site-specific integrase n=1 Tax=Sandaracinobacter neustonicus TaxID=1715348 RepID=A0A501XFZ8_9SPHN|nr:site-specific integrase [Sandaracinobacter neustonicus]TPE59466.1 site-specific integrase [Sandaracinobacter neustonicus]